MMRSKALLLGAASVLSAYVMGLTVPVTLAAQQQPVQLEIFLTQFAYDPGSGTRPGQYTVVVSITDPSRVQSIDPRLLDLQTGENIRFGDHQVDVTAADFSFTLPTTQLQTGRKYRLAIRAYQKGSNNQYVRHPTQNPSEDPLVFASQEFAYDPRQLATPTFGIDGVRADFAKHDLQIAVHYSETARRLRFDAVIADKTGGLVGRLERSDLVLEPDGLLHVRLLDAMERSDQAGEYRLMFRVYEAPDRKLDGGNASGDKLIGEQAIDFTLPPAPSPAFTERVSTALTTHPWLGWSTVGVVIALALVYTVRTFVPRKRKRLPRPYNLEPIYSRTPVTSDGVAVTRLAGTGRERPGMPKATITAQPRVAGQHDHPVCHPEPTVQARVILSALRRATPTVFSNADTAALVVTSPTGPGERYELGKDEVRIGRDDDNDIVIKDKYASRRHAVVVRHGEDFLWSDNDEVAQHTHINGRVAAASQPLHNGDGIEVGRTILAFESH